jgi:hypothetical protein
MPHDVIKPAHAMGIAATDDKAGPGCPRIGALPDKVARLFKVAGAPARGAPLPGMDRGQGQRPRQRKHRNGPARMITHFRFPRCSGCAFPLPDCSQDFHRYVKLKIGKTGK